MDCQDLELALRRFESSGLAGIVELEGSIESTRKTHLLIKQAGLGVSAYYLSYSRCSNPPRVGGEGRNKRRGRGGRGTWCSTV